MVMCSRCKKRAAVVFITKMEGNEAKNEGLCLKCAKELKIPNVDAMMNQLGIDEDELENITDQMEEIFSDIEDENFSPGGAPSKELFDRIMNTIQAEQNEGISDKNPSSDEPDKKAKRQGKAEKEAPKLKFLNSYCENLTRKAKEGKLDRVVGRDNEMLRVLQILNRRTKNNPCLIGEPGVGKTAIAEGIAQKIADGNVPAKLADKEVYLLDLTALVAGTQFRGQFESRVKGLLEEVKRVGNVILVIDEVHTLVGTGDAEGTQSAANMMKPALSRGEVQVIGATTMTEYRKYIEKDAALERRFQPVIVNEPSVEETVEMLKGIKAHYEQFHNIKIPMLLVRKAVDLSERYVTDRFLPDKAIDLLDEACSNATLKDPRYSRLFSERKELAKTSSELDALEAKEEREEADYAKIAELRAAECRLKSSVEETENDLKDKEITLDDIVTVIELWTGIPSTSIKASETEKLRGLEETLRKRIVGQDKAIKAVADAVRRGRVSLVPRKRPISFIFTGPTGVGKTELVKVLSKELFDSPETLIRLDMSEFMEKHSVSRIIGSPPGYVGYDEAGQLTEKIRRKPYSVILFDEIEKAHPDVLNILLQVLDDGKITDAHGRVVSFEHTIIVMTSNAGSNLKGSGTAGFNKSVSLMTEEKSKKALGEFLRPEFLNRVDEIITFDPLPRELFGDIVRIFLSDLADGLREREIGFECSDAAVEKLADLSYSSEYGARNVRRVVQREIEDKVVTDMCDSDMIPKKVSVDVKDGELSIVAE